MSEQPGAESAPDQSDRLDKTHFPADAFAGEVKPTEEEMAAHAADAAEKAAQSESPAE